MKISMARRHELRSWVNWVVFVLCTILTLPSILDAQVQEEWKLWGDLLQARHHHRAIYLGNGRILVAGGYVGSQGILDGSITNATEIIDLLSHTVVEGPVMSTARAEFSYLVDKHGDVIVFGGYSGDGSSKTVEKYIVATNRWEKMGDMVAGRRQHAAAYLDEDRVLLFCGYSSRTAEIYRLSTGVSLPIEDFPSMANSARNISPQGTIPTFWGFRELGSGSVKSVNSYKYDEITKTWVVHEDFGLGVAAPEVVVMSSGYNFLCGGATEEAPFTCTKSTFVVNEFGMQVSGPEVLEGRQWHTMIEWTPGTVLVGGGITDGVGWSRTCELIDVDGHKVKAGPMLNVSRAFHQMVVATDLPGGPKALMISGLNEDANTSTIEILESECTGEFGSANLLATPIRTRGTAVKEGNAIVLTDTVAYSAGSAWVAGKVKIIPEFDTRFSFVMSKGSDNAQPDGGSEGADGVVLVMQNLSIAPLGLPGQGLGYENTPHGLAIEFDSYRNAAFSDPSGSHVAVQLGDGNRLNPYHADPYLKAITSENVPSFVADGTTYYARVVYEGGILKVFVGTTDDLSTPVITLPINISSELKLGTNGTLFLGFTSATGFATERHEITSWTLTGCDAVVLGVNDDNTSPQAPFTIQPSPARDVAQLVLGEELTSGVVQIVEVNGSIVWSSGFTNNSAHINLPVHQMSSGTYAVRVITERESWTQMWTVVR